MSKINSALLSEGISFEEEITLKPPFYVDNKTGEEVNVKLSTTQKLGNIAHLNKLVGFVDYNGKSYIYLNRDPKQGDVIVPLMSKDTRDYFRLVYYTWEKLFCSDKSLDVFLATLEAMCKKHNRRHNVFRRVGMKDGKIYIDLGNSENEFVEVDEDGYRIIKSPPLIFLRHEDALPLPKPDQSVAKEQVMQLQDFLNCRDPNNFKLVVCYLIHLFFPENYDGGKVILALDGQAGSAKSTFTKIIKSLVDPSSNDLLSTPQSIKELYLYAKSQWVLTFDNMSAISQALSDALCRLSTGTGYSARQLYSDDDLISFKLKRCIIINGISDYMKREDVIDRCLMFNLPVISYRVTEAQFWQDFESKKSEIFSALLNILSGTMKMLPKAYVNENFRMADFAKIGQAVELYMGWQSREEDDFCTIYKRNLQKMASDNLHQNVISSSLLHFLKTKFGKLEYGFKFKMTPHELFKALRNQNVLKDFANPEFPNDASAFSKELINNLAPTFQKVGIKIVRGHSTYRYIGVSAEAGVVDEKLI